MSVELKKAGKTTVAGAIPMMTAGELFAKVMDSEAAHTSFGKLVLGAEKSSPQFCTLYLCMNNRSLRNWRSF